MITKYCLYLILITSHSSVLASQWPYLASQPFKQRQKIALEWSADCDTIIEIGGAGTPIDNFVANKNIIVVDPAIAHRENDNVLHVRAKFEDWYKKDLISSNNYAVLILGLALDKMKENGWSKLYELIDNSSKTIIEYSTTYKSAKKQIKSIKKNINKSCVEEHELDLSNYDFSKYKKVNPHRKICLFK